MPQVSTSFRKALQATLIIAILSPATSNESAHAADIKSKFRLQTESGATDVIAFALSGSGHAAGF